MQDLRYLQQPRYDVDWNNTLASAKTLTAISEVEQAKGDVKILYESIQKYEEIAGYFKILPEWKVTQFFYPVTCTKLTSTPTLDLIPCAEYLYIY